MSEKRKSAKNAAPKRNPSTNGPVSVIGTAGEAAGAIKKKQSLQKSAETKKVNGNVRSGAADADAMAICSELVQQLVLNGSADAKPSKATSSNQNCSAKNHHEPQPIIINNNSAKVHNKNNQTERSSTENGDHDDRMCNSNEMDGNATLENPITISSPSVECNGIVITNSSLREAQRSMRNDSYSSESSTSSEFAFDGRTPATVATIQSDEIVVDIKEYVNELQMPDLIRVIQKDLSEPYSIYTYRYFIHNWPKLCFLSMHGDKCIGAIVCKLDAHRQTIRRGYIAMLAVDKDYRKLKIGTTLVQKAIEVTQPTISFRL